MSLPRSLSIAIAAAAAALFAGCDGQDSAPVSPADGPAKTAPQLAPHRFRLEGPRPWNGALYFAVGAAIDGDEPYEGTILDESGVFYVAGPPHAPYHVRSEIRPTAAERRMLWMVDARGILGPGVSVAPGARDDAEPVVARAPPRTRIIFRAPAGDGGPDAVTLVHEASGTSATAYRDPRQGYFLAIWDDVAGNAYRNIAPARPWSIDDFAPGEYVIAARLEGRQWTARRATLSPGVPLVVDAGVLPAGGGTVICEDGNAWLLLGGDLPVPAPRITTTLHLRSVWHGVPPGAHAVRYPDGREVEIAVEDGGTTRLPR